MFKDMDGTELKEGDQIALTGEIVSLNGSGWIRVKTDATGDYLCFRPLDVVKLDEE